MKQPGPLLVIQNMFQALIDTAADGLDHVEITFQGLRCSLTWAVEPVQVINIICDQYGSRHQEGLSRWNDILAHSKVRKGNSGISKKTPAENPHAHRCFQIENLRRISGRRYEIAPTRKHGSLELGIVMLVAKPSLVIEGKNPRTGEIGSKRLHLGDGECQ